MDGWKRNVADWVLGLALIALAIIAAMTSLWTTDAPKDQPITPDVTVVIPEAPLVSPKDDPCAASKGRVYKL